MATPAAGRQPRMQMYVWDNVGGRSLQVTSPPSLAKLYATGAAIFGQQSFILSGEVASTVPADACTAITNNVAGKIVFVDRGGLNGNCTFVLKAQNAVAAGAIGVIVGNVATSASPQSTVSMGCSTNASCTPAEMAYPPMLQVILSDANAFRSALAGGNVVRVTMRRDPSVNHDGTIDNQIITHEWMHYMSNRLIANGNGLTSNQSRGMGEGWSDFASMLLSVRPDDTRFASNSTFNGAYGMALYVATGGSNGPETNNGTYWGIRRVPYSTDMTRNPLTLKHVTTNVPIEGATVRYGATGDSNSEVHASGEVWATMLWEAYAALLRDTIGSAPRLTFAQAQQRMKQYLVASLRMTPADPTFVEARDAVLAAAFARDVVDYQRFWEAFAKRGAGVNAVAPDRYSNANYTATNDFNAGGALSIVSVTFDDNIASCVRNGSLETGETGAMRVVFKNTGATRLESTTLTVSSTDSALTFPSASTAVPASNPGETVTANVIASLATGVVTVLKPDVTITVNDPRITATGGLKSIHLARLNAVGEPKSTALDDVEGASSWTVAGTGAAEWRQIEVSPRDHRWFAAEPYGRVDTSLVSPPLVVAPSGNFTFSFRHRFAFDYFADIFGTGFIDGGVIEISTDNGQSWIDIGNRIDPTTLSYGNATILRDNGSAIEGRKSFQATSPGFSAATPSSAPFATTRVNLGSDYAGKQVRVRFRSVTADDHSFAPRLGWEIDDIAFSNLTNLPFSALNADRGVCGVSASNTLLVASSAIVDPGTAVTFTATVSASTAPTGSVDFLDNGTILGTALIQNGVARFTTATLAAGTHNVVATFNGGKNFAASTSSRVSLQVGPAGPQRRRTVGH
jgi:large repetitive protein